MPPPKTHSVSLKSKKRNGVATAETFVVEGMHEPIIDPERQFALLTAFCVLETAHRRV